MSIKEFNPIEIKEFMVALTAKDYNYTASAMDVYIPSLMADKSNDGKSTNISIPSDIFKSKENIIVSSTLVDLHYITVKVSPSFTATFKALNYDSKPGPHFPKGSMVRLFVPDLNLEKALIVPLF